MLDLEWLIHPFPKALFFADVWQKRCVLVASSRPAALANLFDKKAVERIIEFAQPKPPAIRLASAAQEGRLEIPILPNGRINVDQLRKYYLGGNSVILNSVEDFDPKVAALARSIETEMGARVQVNAYLTPPAAQGFRAHYDTHDVLVAQVEGEKLWKIQGADSACPLHELIDGDPRTHHSGTVGMEIRMRPGDVLYIPRGWIHEAATESEASLHITIGIHPPLAKDLLHAAVDVLASQHSLLRRALPIGALASEASRAELEQLFTELVTLMAVKAPVSAAAETIDDQLLRRGRSGGDGHLFSDAEQVANLTCATRLERRFNVPCRVVRTEQGVGLQFLNGLIKGPDCFVEALQYVARSSAQFAVSELPGLLPDHQLVLAAALVTDGLCRRC